MSRRGEPVRRECLGTVAVRWIVRLMAGMMKYADNSHNLVIMLISKLWRVRVSGMGEPECWRCSCRRGWGGVK